MVLGGVQGDGSRDRSGVAGGQQPLGRDAAPVAAAVRSGGRGRRRQIFVTGGLDAEGKLLTTTEIFDGNTWTLGAPTSPLRDSCWAPHRTAS